MATLTQILVFSTYYVIVAECNSRFIHHFHKHHYHLPDNPLFVMISDFDHLNEGFHHDETTKHHFSYHDLNYAPPLLNEPQTSSVNDLNEEKEDLKESNIILESEVMKADRATEINPEISGSEISNTVKQQVKRDSNKTDSEVKPSTTQVTMDDDKDPHAIKFPGPHDGIKTNVDNKDDANPKSTTPDGSDDKDKLSKNSDYLLIPIATAYNPSLTFANRFNNDETPANLNTAVLPENSNAGLNSYQVFSPNIQGPATNPDINLQNSYNLNQGLYGNQPTNQFDNTAANLLTMNNYPASNIMASNQPNLYTVVNPNNIGDQGINNGIPSNQYYAMNNPQQNNAGYQSNTSPPTYNLVTLNNQPNNVVPLNNQPNNMLFNQPINTVPSNNQPDNNNIGVLNNQQNNMIPLYNVPNNFISLNNQPNNMVPSYNQPNNNVPIKNQPNNFVSLNNQRNNFVGQSNLVPNNYGDKSNQPNNVILLNNPQNNLASLNSQPSNSGGLQYTYGTQPNNLISLNNQPNNLMPLNNQPSYYLPNNFVPLNNQPNNMVGTYGNQPTYFVPLKNQPNNLGSYGNQPNNWAMNGGSSAVMPNVPTMQQTPTNNVNGDYPLYSFKDEAESDNSNETDKSAAKQ